MNKPINCRKFFLAVGIVLISFALLFRGYVEYQKQVHGLNLQIGHSLYPVVSDYFSWSKEEPLKPGELPKRGEFYSYRRPESAAKKPMEKFYQRLSGGRTATKQCHGVSEDGLLWDTGSDDKMVPVADIVGHVIEIYDSKYRELSKTPEGRLRLWAERHHLPADIAISDKYVAITDGNSFRVYAPEGIISTVNGEISIWSRGRLWWTADDGRDFSLDPVTGKSQRLVVEPLSLSAEFTHHLSGRIICIGIAGNYHDVICKGNIMVVDTGSSLSPKVSIRVTSVIYNDRITEVRGESVDPSICSDRVLTAVL